MASSSPTTPPRVHREIRVDIVVPSPVKRALIRGAGAGGGAAATPPPKRAVPVRGDGDEEEVRVPKPPLSAQSRTPKTPRTAAEQYDAFNVSDGPGAAGTAPADPARRLSLSNLKVVTGTGASRSTADSTSRRVEELVAEFREMEQAPPKLRGAACEFADPFVEHEYRNHTRHANVLRLCACCGGLSVLLLAAFGIGATDSASGSVDVLVLIAALVLLAWAGIAWAVHARALHDLAKSEGQAAAVARTSAGVLVTDGLLAAACMCLLTSAVLSSAYDARSHAAGGASSATGIDAVGSLVAGSMAWPAVLPFAVGLYFVTAAAALVVWGVYAAIAAGVVWPDAVGSDRNAGFAILWIAGAVGVSLALVAAREISSRRSWHLFYQASTHLRDFARASAAPTFSSSMRRGLISSSAKASGVLRTPLQVVIDKLTQLRSSSRSSHERVAIDEALDLLYHNPDMLAIDYASALQKVMRTGRLDERTTAWVNAELNVRRVPSHARLKNQTLLERRRSGRASGKRVAFDTATANGSSSDVSGIESPTKGSGRTMRTASDDMLSVAHATQVGSGSMTSDANSGGSSHLAAAAAGASAGVSAGARAAAGVAGAGAGSGDSAAAATTEVVVGGPSAGNPRHLALKSADSFMTMTSVKSFHNSPAAGGVSPAASDIFSFAPPEVADLAVTPDMEVRLKDVLSWTFDVLSFSELCDKRPLEFVVPEVLSTGFNLIETFALPVLALRNFLRKLDADYCYEPSRRNPYHNSVHAADVVQACAVFLTQPRVAAMVDGLEALSILLAAAVHDFRHPGVNSNFLIATSHELALRYNDMSVLENYHVAEAFHLLRHGDLDVLAGLDPKDRTSLRYTTIQCVLATDLAHGQRYFGAFKMRALGTARDFGEGDEDTLLLLQVLLKCADVSHPARPTATHVRWSHLVTEEFFQQGDVERERGMPISPLCDREDSNLSQSQIGFIEFVVKPVFDGFAKFCDNNEWMGYLVDNSRHWRMTSTRLPTLESTDDTAAE